MGLTYPLRSDISSIMRYFLLLFLTFSITTCTTKQSALDAPRMMPHYRGVDTRAYPYIQKYVKLANQNNIKFTKPVSVGFTNIDDDDSFGRAVAVCFYGKNFREIEIDKNEWAKYPEVVREQLLFHELTHCFCGRGHNFVNSKNQWEEYPKIGIQEILSGIFGRWPFNSRPSGVYLDKCPISIMYPRVLPKQCDLKHNQDYIKEMFIGCEAW